MHNTLIERIARHDPKHTALIVTHPAGDQQVSYGELIDAVERWASWLAGRGLKPGARIAVCLPNVAAWPILELAAARCGLIIAPVNTRWRATEIAHLLRRTEPALFIHPSDFQGIDFAAILAEAAKGLPPIETVMVDCSALLPPAGDIALPPDKLGDQPLNLLATSGSTGEPKFAVHTQSGLVIRFSAAAERFAISAGDTVLCALPMCGIWGLGITLATLMTGGTAVLMPVFDADEAAKAMTRLNIAHVHGGDNLILAIVQSDRLARGSLPDWKTCYFGAFTGRDPADVIAAVEPRGGSGLRAAQAYGSSEGLAFVAGCSPDAPPEDRRHAGGPLLDGSTRARIVDPQTGASVESGQRGEIQLRGATVTSGYFGDDEATSLACTDDGWWRTGDLGERTANGFRFIARMGDALRLRGTLVDPAEIEAALCSHQAVAEAHVVGAKDFERGDVAVAFTRLAAGSTSTEQELRDFVRSMLASYKVPERIVLDAQIPVTVSANATKVRKDVLREMAQAYLESTPPIT